MLTVTQIRGDSFGFEGPNNIPEATIRVKGLFTATPDMGLIRYVVTILMIGFRSFAVKFVLLEQKKGFEFLTLIWMIWTKIG